MKWPLGPEVRTPMSLRRGCFRWIQNEVPQRLKPLVIDSAQRGPEGPHYPSSAQNFPAVCSAVSL